MIARVYAAISAVTAALAPSGIAKTRFNLDDGYAYRSIDDVVIRLAPLLAEQKLCVLPRVLNRATAEREGLAGEALLSTSLTVAYDIVSAEDGSAHTVEVMSEALDGGDKGTAKALQSAYKYAMIQAFAIPVSGSEEADARSPRLKAQPVIAKPVQGWEQWASDVAKMVAGCESVQAIDHVQSTYRKQFSALQRERSELYAEVGTAIAVRRAELVVCHRDARDRDGLSHPAVAPSDDPADLAQIAAEHGKSGLNLAQNARESSVSALTRPQSVSTEERAKPLAPRRACIGLKTARANPTSSQNVRTALAQNARDDSMSKSALVSQNGPVQFKGKAGPADA